MAKNCLIYEKMNDISGFEVKKSDDGFMHLSGVFGVCGVRNNNRRVYDKANYTEMVNRLQQKIQNEGCPGELEHPNSMNVNLANISHKIDSISIDENGVVSGEITLLNTPNGKIAQELVKGGVQLFISSRATGNVAEDGNVKLENLATYDLVGTPGFSQAKLHLNEGQVVESLGEDTYYICNESDNKLNENENDMDNKELLEKIDLLEARIKELESRPTVEQIATGVQRWITEEYEPELKNAISESMLSTDNNEFISQLADGIQDWMVNEYAPVIEKWVKEEYDQSVQDWIADNYSPVIEKWIKEEYSGDLQKWLVNEYAPAIEGWIKEEYTQGVQAWVTEHYTPQINDWVKEQIKESKKSSLDSIDQTLALLESTAKKPSYGRRSLITENNDNDEPKFIREMPETARVKWNLCNEATKDAIMRKAKLYSFVNENSIQEFWNNVDFTEVKPSKTIYEGLENIQDEWEKNIRLSLRKNRI